MKKIDKDPFKERKSILKRGIEKQPEYSLFSSQAPSYVINGILNGRGACRAPFFNKDVVIKIPNTKDKKDLVHWWFEEGCKIFKIEDSDFYNIEEDNEFIYIYLFLFEKKWVPSINQWFFFPGYTYFRRFLYLYRRIRNESKLNERQSCVVASYIVCRGFNQEAALFGNKFPFVVFSSGSLIITRDIKVTDFYSTQMPCCSIAVFDHKGEFSNVRGMLYLIPEVDVEKYSFEEMYLKLVEQIEYGFDFSTAKGLVGYSNAVLNSFVREKLEQIIISNKEKIVGNDSSSFLPLDFSLLNEVSNNKKIKSILTPFKKKILAATTPPNYSYILNEKADVKKILASSNS
jgi:hypothetical protein